MLINLLLIIYFNYFLWGCVQKCVQVPEETTKGYLGDPL